MFALFGTVHVCNIDYNLLLIYGGVGSGNSEGEGSDDDEESDGGDGDDEQDGEEERVKMLECRRANARDGNFRGCSRSQPPLNIPTRPLVRLH